ncbi:MAG: alpha/beta hydrolase [Granulosicoccus sp.]
MSELSYATSLCLMTAMLTLTLIAIPVHADTAPFESREIVAPGPNGELAGTLLLPSHANPPFNTVLILPGSGPTDRDGNNPGSLKASSYRLLAEGLAERGVASVRVDKRGLGESSAAGDANQVTFKLYVDDVVSWLGVIADMPQLTGDVWLVGHSEGAMIATVAAGRELDQVRALVMLAAPGRTLGVVLREQLASNPANVPVLAEAFAAIEMLERNEPVDPETLHPGLRPLFNVSTQHYLGEMIRFDPAAALRELGERDDPLPVLIVHGMRDIQVSSEDARALAQARPDAELVMIADMNHVLKSVSSDDRGANLATYSNPELPLVQNVVDSVADFIDNTGIPH